MVLIADIVEEYQKKMEAARDPIKEIARIKNISPENAVVIVGVEYAEAYLTSLKKEEGPNEQARTERVD